MIPAHWGVEGEETRARPLVPMLWRGLALLCSAGRCWGVDEGKKSNVKAGRAGFARWWLGHPIACQVASVLTTGLMSEWIVTRGGQRAEICGGTTQPWLTCTVHGGKDLPTSLEVPRLWVPLESAVKKTNNTKKYTLSTCLLPTASDYDGILAGKPHPDFGWGKGRGMSNTML